MRGGEETYEPPVITFAADDTIVNEQLNCAKVTVNEPYTNSGLIDSQVQVDNDNCEGRNGEMAEYLYEPLDVTLPSNENIGRPTNLLSSMFGRKRQW